MKTFSIAVVLVLSLGVVGLPSIQSNDAHPQSAGSTPYVAGVPPPEQIIGFVPGEDRKLASWASVVAYFRKLGEASNRVIFAELGKSTMGAPFIMATISSPDNLERLDEYRKIQAGLADPRTLGRNPDRRATALIKSGKAIVLITCAIHSTEVGSYLSSMVIADRLARSNDPDVLKVLDETIVLLVPSLNPDGVDIVKRWYDKTVGTKYEGTNPPELYHNYTGHDNNRDWYAFTQVETQLTVDRIHNVWRPHIVHDIHQMGSNGARLFLPPYTQPVEPNVPEQIIEGYTELGTFIAEELLASGLKGITTNSIFDAWTPARAYSHYHGGARILSETASARLASPIQVRFEDLRSGRGYDPRKTSANFPVLWPGGEWRLADITRYMSFAAFALMRHAAINRERWLERFYSIGKEAVRDRRAGELAGFRIRFSERAPYLFEILNRGGVEVIHTQVRKLKGRSIPEESLVLLNQPYGNFAKALLEVQQYPDLRDTSGEPISPYDVTAHTLPLLMGVEVEPIYAPIKARGRTADARPNEVGRRISTRRIGIYQSYVPSMDEGWTRWVVQQSSFSPEERLKAIPIHDQQIRGGNLRASFDTIIIPDQTPEAIQQGRKTGTMPEEYTRGLGTDGVRELERFVQDGGSLVCLNRASIFAVWAFKLPLRDVTAGLKRDKFYAPGSILRIELDPAHAIAQSMPAKSIAWVEHSPAFEIADGLKDQVRVIARFPVADKLVLSGWLLGDQVLKGRAALVEVIRGKGRIVLFGFRPQYRGQSLATYPLLFNAIMR